MSTWIFADVHGELDKLKSCLGQVNLQKGDTIIGLGDYVDRGKNSYEVVELLLFLQKDYNCIWLRGNHDQCFFEGLTSGNYELMNQGCKETIESYINALDLPDEVYIKNHRWVTGFDIESMPLTHYEFFKNLKYYYVDSQNNLFVHAGINRHHHIHDEIYNDESVFIWDRDFVNSARSHALSNLNKFTIKDNFKEVFIGHTSTQCFGEDKPMKFGNVNLLDTGCGKSGVLTIMNLETKQYYQSL